MPIPFFCLIHSADTGWTFLCTLPPSVVCCVALFLWPFHWHITLSVCHQFHLYLPPTNIAVKTIPDHAPRKKPIVKPIMALSFLPTNNSHRPFGNRYLPKGKKINLCVGNPYTAPPRNICNSNFHHSFFIFVKATDLSRPLCNHLYVIARQILNLYFFA